MARFSGAIVSQNSLFQPKRFKAEIATVLPKSFFSSWREYLASSYQSLAQSFKPGWTFSRKAKFLSTFRAYGFVWKSSYSRRPLWKEGGKVSFLISRPKLWANWSSGQLRLSDKFNCVRGFLSLARKFTETTLELFQGTFVMSLHRPIQMEERRRKKSNPSA